jgi:hypothetical protein
MSRVSPEFGRIIKNLLVENGLTFRGAAMRSSISAAYWKDMSDGRVPSEDILEKIQKSFEDESIDELRAAAGYAPIPGKIDPVRAVEFALRGQNNIPEEGKEQILDFVRKIEQKYKVGH